MTTLSMKSAAGRAVITARIVAAITEAAPGAEITTGPGLNPSETRIAATLNGAEFFASAHAESTWGILGGWIIRRRDDLRFSSCFGVETGGGINPHHGCKATGPHANWTGRGVLDAESFEGFLYQLQRCFRAVADQSAFRRLPVPA